MIGEMIKVAEKHKLLCEVVMSFGKAMARGQANKLDYIDAISTILQMAADDEIYLPDPE